METLEKLEDLAEQAVTERSHYYTAAVLKETIKEITALKRELAEAKVRLSVSHRAYQSYIDAANKERDEAIMDQIAAEKERDELAVKCAVMAGIVKKISETAFFDQGLDQLAREARHALSATPERVKAMLAVVEAAEMARELVRELINLTGRDAAPLHKIDEALRALREEER